MVVLVPVPVVVIAPGDLVNVQLPDDGKPPKTTMPVATLQVGCVMVPTVGATDEAFTVSVATADVALPAPLQLVT